MERRIITTENLEEDIKIEGELHMMGPIIPILHNTLKLPRGFGIRNTVSLLQMRQSVDNALGTELKNRYLTQFPEGILSRSSDTFHHQ